VVNAENMPLNKRVVIVSNHPLGALDGIAMIDWVSSIYGDNVKFVVNDLLMAVKPLNDVFLPVNKFGKQSRNSSANIEEVFAGDDPIIIFPAGLVSRKGRKGIRDLKWQKMFINKAIEYGRDIIPVHFSGENSSFFYNFAKTRSRLGLKFNIEMIFLPREIFRCKNTHFTITVGNPLSYTIFKGGKNAASEAKQVKRLVYKLKERKN
jgi:putative hemolysin